jgi:hypothetical protein
MLAVEHCLYLSSSEGMSKIGLHNLITKLCVINRLVYCVSRFAYRACVRAFAGLLLELDLHHGRGRAAVEPDIHRPTGIRVVLRRFPVELPVPITVVLQAAAARRVLFYRIGGVTRELGAADRIGVETGEAGRI